MRSVIILLRRTRFFIQNKAKTYGCSVHFASTIGTEWIKRERVKANIFFGGGGAGGESVDGTHVRLVTGVMQIFTSWYPHGPFSAIWDKGHNLACMKCTFISSFIRKWIFSFLFKLPEYRMKINCVPGLMTHIHLHLSSSMSIFKRN